MKTKQNIWISPVILLGLLVMLQSGCKKDSSTEQQVSKSTVTDIDGNVYNTVKIGTQVWMAENLKTTKYRNGDSIPNVNDGGLWSALTSGAYCNYNNDLTTGKTYGHLYNWTAVTDSRNIAPVGWHVPSDAEYDTLISYLGTTEAGGKLKGTGTTYWNSPNKGATNETGFNALPGGDRSNTGTFHYMGLYACWWCTKEYSASDGWEYVLTANSSGVIKMNFSKGLGLSVRCIKD
jgi:uncharacterized protein (TIGR02145 family)